MSPGNKVKNASNNYEYGFKFLLGNPVPAYQANTYKPLRKGEGFYFKGRRCTVTKVFEKGVMYEYDNIGIRNGSRLHGFMFLSWDYIRANGSKPYSHWKIN